MKVKRSHDTTTGGRLVVRRTNPACGWRTGPRAWTPIEYGTILQAPSAGIGSAQPSSAPRSPWSPALLASWSLPASAYPDLGRVRRSQWPWIPFSRPAEPSTFRTTLWSTASRRAPVRKHRGPSFLGRTTWCAAEMLRCSQRSIPNWAPPGPVFPFFPEGEHHLHFPL